MKKFNLESIVADVKKQFKDNQKFSKRVGIGTNLSKLEEKDFIKMPQWWQTISGVLGLPFGKIVMIAGLSDTGKTSTAIEAMKAAQEQGVGVIYVETEAKCNENDLRAWGVDPNGILLVQSSIAEEAFELLFATWDSFKRQYPGEKLLVVFDSIGNVVSQRDSEIDLTQQDSKPGGKGKINRLAISKMIAKRDEDNAAILLLNYTYDNIGSHGKTNAGGAALNFFSSLTFQSSRKGWYEKTVKGQKVKAGVIVRWSCYKNHLDRTSVRPKVYDLKISSEGISVLGSQDDE
jgi:RecA/RadA recombinase